MISPTRSSDSAGTASGVSGSRSEVRSTNPIARASVSATLDPLIGGKAPEVLPPNQVRAAPSPAGPSGRRAQVWIGGKQYQLRFHVPLARKKDHAGLRTGRLSRNILPIKLSAGGAPVQSPSGLVPQQAAAPTLPIPPVQIERTGIAAATDGAREGVLPRSGTPPTTGSSPQSPVEGMALATGQKRGASPPRVDSEMLAKPSPATDGRQPAQAVPEIVVSPATSTDIPDIVVTPASDPPRQIPPSHAAGDTLAQRLDLNRVDQLSSIDAYPGRPERTHVFIQGEACHFSPSSPDAPDGLFTFGAGPCLVLKVDGFDAQGRLARIAMTHNDDFVSEQALAALFAPFRDCERLEASFVGGSRSTARRALAACDRFGAEVVFSAVNFDESRIDSVAVDAHGRLYYGERDFSAAPGARDVMRRLLALERRADVALEWQLAIADLTS